MNLEKSFRELRNKWFVYHLENHEPERDWEDEERTRYREEGNRRMRIKYDAQTEDIIRGIERPIAPTCQFDMDKL